MEPFINPLATGKKILDWAEKPSDEKKQGLLNYPKVAGAGFAKGGNILGNILPNTRDYIADTFPAKDYPNLGVEQLPSFLIPGMPDETYDYLGATGGVLNDKRDELLYETFKRAPLLAASGGNPFLLEAERAAGENESPITALGTVGMLGLGGKALGSAGAIAKPQVQKFRQKINEVKAIKSPVEMANKIAIDDLSKHEAYASKGYESIFNKTNEAGITKAKVPKLKNGIKNFLKDATKDEIAPVAKAHRTQNLRDIHEGYKSLGEYIAEIDRDAKKGRLPKEVKDARSEAVKTRNDFEKSLKTAFERAGGKELANQFDSYNTYWKENVVDNKYNPKLKAYREIAETGRASDLDFAAQKLMKDLSKDTKFQSYMAKQYPEVNAYVKRMKGLGKFKGIASNFLGLKLFGALFGAVGL